MRLATSWPNAWTKVLPVGNEWLATRLISDRSNRMKTKTKKTAKKTASKAKKPVAKSKKK